MDIEKLATSAVVNSLSKTEVLEAFINSGDKEPSWDGNVFIYKDSHKTKIDLKKVPVQVKGRKQKKTYIKEAPKFSVDLVDLKNWLNDGGVFLFVVFIKKDGNGDVYYNSLTPIKIQKIIELDCEKKKTSIPLTKFPDDNNEKVTVLLNFHRDRQKQTSFANSSLVNIEDLKRKGILDNLTFSTTIYGKNITPYDIDTALLQNDLYAYASIKGLSIPQPLLEISSDRCIIREIPCEIKVRNKSFYQSYRFLRSKEKTEILFGKSTRLTLQSDSPDDEKNNLFFNPDGMLSDYIRDTEFFIAILEEKVIGLNGKIVPVCFKEKADIDQYKRYLLYYYDIKKMLDHLKVNKEFDCRNLTENEENNLRCLIHSLVYNEKIKLTGCNDICVYGRYKIGNLILLIMAHKNDDSGYQIQSFFCDQEMAIFEISDKKKEHPHSITQYVLLTRQDFLECSNIDYNKIIEALQKNDTSSLVLDRCTLFMLEMLKAYDEQKEKDEQLLLTAEKYCKWIIESCDEPSETMILNSLQIAKRKRDLNHDEKEKLLELDKQSSDLNIRCAINLLLGKTELAQDCFDEMNPEDQKQFIEYPICSFGDLKQQKLEEK